MKKKPKTLKALEIEQEKIKINYDANSETDVFDFYKKEDPFQERPIT